MSQLQLILHQSSTDLNNLDMQIGELIRSGHWRPKFGVMDPWLLTLSWYTPTHKDLIQTILLFAGVVRPVFG